MSKRIKNQAKTAKISVLLAPDLAARFTSFCESRGLKKSTYIVKLIKDHLHAEAFSTQLGLNGIEKTGEDT